MDKLREEIIEAEKIRADLIKWKLILVAGLGAAGLGLNGNSRNDMTLLLCLIPFVCVYVDLVARHLNLRIHVIAEFMRGQKEEWTADYEKYAESMEKNRVFALETGVLWYSTVFLSVIVIIYGFVMHSKQPVINLVLFISSGFFGIVVAVSIDVLYRKRRTKITSIEG